MTAPNLAKKPPLWRARWNKLNWFTTPSRRLPHGLAGILSVVIGLAIVFDSITGHVHQYSDDQPVPYKILLYAALAMTNAVSGLQMVRVAPKNSQSVFQSCAIFQICLCYFIVRFLPHFTVGWNLLMNTGEAFLVLNDWAEAGLWLIDTAMTVLAIASIMLLRRGALQYTTDLPGSAKYLIEVAATFGCCCLLLLVVYPVQLVVFGQSWFECVQARYSHQASGMVGYIYVPTTLTFSIILFAATLYIRRVISTTVFGLGVLATVAFCLVGAVLSQEVRIPYVSTQRIYLPCVEPEKGTMEEWITSTLDFSLYARRLLTAALGIQFAEGK